MRLKSTAAAQQEAQIAKAPQRAQIAQQGQPADAEIAGQAASAARQSADAAGHIAQAMQLPQTTQAAQAAQRLALAPGTPGVAVPEAQSPALLLSLSSEALASMKEARETLAHDLEEICAEGEAMRKQMEDARKQGKAAADGFEVQRKCMLIAARIMSGDTVPKADYRYLAKNDPNRYEKAIMLRKHKEKPVKHKRLSKAEAEARETVPGVRGGESDKAGSIASIGGKGSAGSTTSAGGIDSVGNAEGGAAVPQSPPELDFLA